MSFGRRNNFLDADFQSRRGRRSAPGGDSSSSTNAVNDNVPVALLKSARQTGVLNLNNRDLTSVPAMVWRINCVQDEIKPESVSLDAGDLRWWEFEETKKLLLNSNRLSELSDDVKLLTCLTIIEARDNSLRSLPPGIGQLQQLKSLAVNRNQLQQLPGELCNCEQLLNLAVADNLLQSLPDRIGSLTCLVDLDVSGNKLTELPDSMRELRELRNLNCSRNALQQLPDGVALLPNLTQLFANNNRLLQLSCPPSGSGYRRLEVLDLSDNQLQRLPVMLHSTNLKELRVSNNRISLLTPDQFLSLTGLKHLELRRNQISELPIEIAHMPQLERLDLTDNSLSSLPYELGIMESLKSLQLEGNPLRTVRREIISRGTVALKQHLASRIASANNDSSPNANNAEPTIVSSLQGSSGIVGAHADIDINEVKHKRCLKFNNKRCGAIPSEVFSCVAELELIKIELVNNELNEIPHQLFDSKFNESLVELSLKNNWLTIVDPQIGKLAALTVLDLSLNSLSNLPEEMAELQCLQQLALIGNKFESIPPVIYNLRNLEHLLLSSNRISQIDANSLRSMRRLATLDVSNNSITNIPPELGLCSQLKTLQLEGNLFRVPRPAQLVKGTAFVLEYLRNRMES